MVAMVAPLICSVASRRVATLKKAVSTRRFGQTAQDEHLLISLF